MHKKLLGCVGMLLCLTAETAWSADVCGFLCGNLLSTKAGPLKQYCEAYRVAKKRREILKPLIALDIAAAGVCGYSCVQQRNSAKESREEASASLDRNPAMGDGIKVASPKPQKKGSKAEEKKVSPAMSAPMAAPAVALIDKGKEGFKTACYAAAMLPAAGELYALLNFKGVSAPEKMLNLMERGAKQRKRELNDVNDFNRNNLKQLQKIEAPRFMRNFFLQESVCFADEATPPPAPLAPVSSKMHDTEIAVDNAVPGPVGNFFSDLNNGPCWIAGALGAVAVLHSQSYAESKKLMDQSCETVMALGPTLNGPLADLYNRLQSGGARNVAAGNNTNTTTNPPGGGGGPPGSGGGTSVAASGGGPSGGGGALGGGEGGQDEVTPGGLDAQLAASAKDAQVLNGSPLGEVATPFANKMDPESFDQNLAQLGPVGAIQSAMSDMGLGQASGAPGLSSSMANAAQGGVPPGMAGALGASGAGPGSAERESAEYVSAGGGGGSESAHFDPFGGKSDGSFGGGGTGAQTLEYGEKQSGFDAGPGGRIDAIFHPGSKESLFEILSGKIRGCADRLR